MLFGVFMLALARQAADDLPDVQEVVREVQQVVELRLRCIFAVKSNEKPNMIVHQLTQLTMSVDRVISSTVFAETDDRPQQLIAFHVRSKITGWHDEHLEDVYAIHGRDAGCNAR